MFEHLLRNGLTAMALVLAYFLVIHRTQHKPMRVWPAVCVMLFTLCMVAVFALTGVSAMNHFRLPNIREGFSLIPFRGMIAIVRDSIRYGEPLFAISNLAGNLVMFAPLGFFLPLIWARWRRLWKGALFGFCTSFLIECTQTFVGRGFDVDDLILNTLGAVLGYVAYRLIRRALGEALERCAIPSNQDTFAWRLLPYLCAIVPFVVSFLYGFVDRAIYMLA